MKVLYITARADIGGGPEHLYQLVSHLPKRVEAYVGCPDDEPYWERYGHLFTGRIQIPHRKFSIKAFRRLWQFVTMHRIEIIHSHGKGAGLYSRLLGILTSAKVIHTFHGLHYRKYNILLGKTYLLYEKFAATLTSALICVSKSEYADVLHMGIANVGKMSIIHNGVSIPQIEDPVRQRARRAIRAEMGIPGDATVIVTVARLSPEKGVLRALDIVKGYNSINSSVYYLIVGDGDERESIETKIRSDGMERYCSVTGFRADVDQILCASDIYLSCSAWEGLPLSILQAMALKIPVVASDVTGNRDIVITGKTGYLYSLDRPEEAVRRLQEIEAGNTAVRLVVANAYNAVKSDYIAEKMAATTLFLYEKILGVSMAEHGPGGRIG